jgi:colicin import membrane protein
MRAVALAVLAHAVLIGALTWGVNWKTSADQPAVEAELWAAVPQQAAPRAVAPPPPPAPAAPEPVPRPAPAPPPPPPPRQVQPDTREADIALEREKEKKRLEEEKKRQQQLEREKRERERKEEERRERLEQEKKERQLAQQKAEREKAEREKAEREKAAKAEQEKQKKLAEDKRKAAAEAKRAEEFRQEQMRRIAGLAGATGGETATGTAQRSAGPSGSYGGKVKAKVLPNIVFPDAITGNPHAEVEVRAAPDGTIVGVRIVKASGNKAWDDAVVRALHKTETLPRDVDGRVPSSMVISFRPKD